MQSKRFFQTTRYHDEWNVHEKMRLFFKFNVIYYISIEIWTFTIIRENHNHENINISIQFEYRNAKLTNDIFDKIDRFSKNN